MVEAVEMALGRRRPAGVIHHPNRGSRYTSPAFGRRLREAGMTASMGSWGDCSGTAMAESCFATLGCERLARQCLPTRNTAGLAPLDSIEGFSNARRRHSALGYLSPSAYERRWTREGAGA